MYVEAHMFLRTRENSITPLLEKREKQVVSIVCLFQEMMTPGGRASERAPREPFAGARGRDSMEHVRISVSHIYNFATVCVFVCAVRRRCCCVF